MSTQPILAILGLVFHVGTCKLAPCMTVQYCKCFYKQVWVWIDLDRGLPGRSSFPVGLAHRLALDSIHVVPFFSKQLRTEPKAKASLFLSPPPPTAVSQPTHHFEASFSSKSPPRKKEVLNECLLVIVNSRKHACKISKVGSWRSTTRSVTRFY